MKLLLIHNVEPQDVVFNTPLEEAVAMYAEFDSVFYTDIPPQEMLEAHYDGVIVSGVPVHYSVEMLDTRVQYLDWVRTVNIPVLGICLGHQNIARLFGSSMIINDEAEDGHVPLRIRYDDAILRNVSAGSHVRAYHGCSVTVPDEFILLASSDTCHNNLMRHRDKDIYGAQFHPELSEDGLQIIKNFASIADERKLAREIEGLFYPDEEYSGASSLPGLIA